MCAATSSTMDLESQTITGNHLPLPTLLYVSRMDALSDAVDDFWGTSTYPSIIVDEGHHRQSLSDVPPPYNDEPPAYTANSEPATLAQYLFKFGFIFPLFWILGAIILASPLRPPPSDASSVWLPEKTESERQQIIVEMRAVEVKWAWRCVWALVSFVVMCMVAGLAAWSCLAA